jgi:AbrB family looped-hinge helix DNA binding protein
MSHATLSQEFKLTIPKAIREQLDLRAGQDFVIVTNGESIVLVPKRSAEDMRGFMRRANPENYRDRQNRH